jgi:transposase
MPFNDTAYRLTRVSVARNRNMTAHAHNEKPLARQWPIAAGNLASTRYSIARSIASSGSSNRIKHFRTLATHYEKHAANYLAMLKLAATHLWLRHNETVT